MRFSTDKLGELVGVLLGEGLGAAIFFQGSTLHWVLPRWGAIALAQPRRAPYPDRDIDIAHVQCLDRACGRMTHIDITHCHVFFLAKT